MKTRFAPSPTGYLHVGGARTALYSWLYAKKHGGQFILRIEDTDQERSTQESIDAIMEGMTWLGLTHDEGPFYQSKRFDRYKEIENQLLQSGHAYKCYCSKERLTQLREEQMANKQKPRYDGCCRDLTEDKDGDYVIRFKNPQDGVVEFDDFIRGTIVISNEELDDVIIARTDGVPTYNFTVVVDDWDMGVTHVVRGDDHINNTPRQINMLHALNAPLPKYGHLPMILGSDGKRLSKRHGAVSVMQYRDDGFLPQALLNYLVRLGWSHGDQEVFSLDEMIELFDVAHVSKSPAAFNTEKLLWLNQHYLKTLSADEVNKHLAWHIEQAGVDLTQGPEIKHVIDAYRERVKTLKELAKGIAYLYQDKIEYEEKSVKKNLKVAAKEPLEKVLAGFDALEIWQAENIHQVIIDTAEQLELKLGKVAQPIRVAVTGTAVSPPVDITLELLGRERTLARVRAALDLIVA